MKDELTPKLLEKINDTETWLTKGQLYLVAEEEGYSPETCGRYLRDMVVAGKIQVDYYKGKRNQKLARYARLETPRFIKPKIQIINGIAYMQ